MDYGPVQLSSLRPYASLCCAWHANTFLFTYLFRCYGRVRVAHLRVGVSCYVYLITKEDGICGNDWWSVHVELIEFARLPISLRQKLSARTSYWRSDGLRLRPTTALSCLVLSWAINKRCCKYRGTDHGGYWSQKVGGNCDADVKW